tara:strand:- start:18528 stop:19616 length:1089 start_codon:yes stop_codon:yes gene_type:complete
MVNTDALLSEWAYRCKKGYPDMDSPSDLKVLKDILNEWEISLPEFQEQVITEQEKKEISVQDIEEILNQIKDDQKALDKIYKFIINRPGEKGFFGVATDSNVTDKTVDTSNAPQVIFDLLSNSGDLKKYIDLEKPGYSEIGKEGNFLDFFEKKSGMSRETLTKMFNFSGKESGRGVGKGEVAMALLFKDVKMASAGAGDLDWSGKSLEVKGSNARLGGRDRKFEGFERTALGQLATKYDKSDEKLTTLITNLADEDGIDNKELLDAVIDFEEKAHPKGDAKKYFTENILGNPIELRKSFTKNLIKHYSTSKNIDHFIWWNSESRFGKYISFTPEEADGLVDKGDLRTNNMFVYQLDPSISKP